ncbi:MAG: DUF4384 domain-containing protein [Desulfosudaceae bacterium]
MMKKSALVHPAVDRLLPLTAVIIFLCLFSASLAGAGNSIITTGQGLAALGNDKTRDQAMDEARALARRDAAEKAATYIQSSSEVEDFTLKKDLVRACAEAVVTILEELESGWVDDPRMGESFRVKVKAEVTPDLAAISGGSSRQSEGAPAWADDPTAPLTVRLTSPDQSYRAGEQFSFFLKGNKPFFARVVYKDSQGNLLQILPNPYRQETYFQGGTIYRLPSGKDQYTFTVVPPFGEETVTVYASTSPLGEVSRRTRGPVYLLESSSEQVASRTRGIQIDSTTAGQSGSAETAEFYETSLTVRTTPAAQ